MGTVLGTRRRAASLVAGAVWRRLGRLTALTTVYALGLGLVLLSASKGGPLALWVMHNFFTFFYIYMVLVLWLGDLWEELGAVAVSAMAAAWLMISLLRSWGGPFWLYGWPRPMPDWGGWLLYVATALALVGVVHKARRQGRRVAREAAPIICSDQAAAPIISSDLENPILVVQGHAQILQGGGVVFDTRLGQQGDQQRE